MAFDTLSQLDSVEILRELAQSLGHTGVVLGQIKDTIETQENYNISDIMRVHDLKTG
jgi:geranylgeranyl pyrophosphate synthase